MQQLVECVPNFSDGRNPNTYNAIANAIRSVPQVRVLDVSADSDHNRTVVTFVGPPQAVIAGAFAGIALAAKLINLDHHQGEHPRLGATDVCPLIPLRGVSPQECVRLAHQLAKRVGDELGIATYMYGLAAVRPERQRLADIRDGEYEQWKLEIGHKPERQPDYGPAQPQPWGATVIGVRPFLIAYNIYLNSNKVDIARQIARNVRETSGGLQHVQAKGFLVDGMAQVSMNLLDFETTPLHRIQELVRQEAAYYGLSINRAELVGLSPQKALMDAARWYLQLHTMRDDQVLEYNLLDLLENDPNDLSPVGFLEATAANQPTPGGGAVAALVGALAAALTQMVAGLTVGRTAYQAVQPQAQSVLEEAADLRQQLTEAISEDSASYQAFLDARRNTQLDETDREKAVEQATIQAAKIPLKVALLSQKVILLARSIVEIGNKNAATDAAAGAIMARAAVETAVLNVHINVKSLKNRELAQKLRDEIDTIRHHVNELAEEVTAVAAKRGGY